MVFSENFNLPYFFLTVPVETAYNEAELGCELFVICELYYNRFPYNINNFIMNLGASLLNKTLVVHSVFSIYNKS